MTTTTKRPAHVGYQGWPKAKPQDVVTEFLAIYLSKYSVLPPHVVAHPQAVHVRPDGVKVRERKDDEPICGDPSIFWAPEPVIAVGRA